MFVVPSACALCLALMSDIFTEQEDDVLFRSGPNNVLLSHTNLDDMLRRAKVKGFDPTGAVGLESHERNY